MEINICGIPHTIKEYPNKFNVDTHFGQIDHLACEIRVNAELNREVKKECICHEFVHGALVHLGYNDLHNDEQFVQAMGNAIYQAFGKDMRWME